MDLTKLFEAMSQKKNFKCRGQGATNEELEYMERTLRITLPESYVTFLKRFGFVVWAGHAIFGISNDERFQSLGYDFDAVRNTLDARNEELPPDFAKLPQHGLVIETYGGGGYYFLYSKDSLRNGEVVLLIDETWRKQEEGCWKSFEDFLTHLLQSGESQKLIS